MIYTRKFWIFGMSACVGCAFTQVMLGNWKAAAIAMTIEQACFTMALIIKDITKS